MTENIAIKVTNIIYGNEDIEIVFDDTTIKFYVSYMGREFLTTLILVAEELPEYGHSNVTFLDEPGYMKVSFEKCEGSDGLSIDIETEKRMPEDAQDPVKYHFVTRYEVFKAAVIKAALDVLKVYGLVGFMHSWLDRNTVFPVGELLSLMGIGSVFDGESESYRSSIKDELQLLMFAIDS